MGADMRRFWIALIAVSTIAFSQIASAADLPLKAPAAPSPPAFTWTGCYVGLNAGWGGARNALSTTVDPQSNMNGTARALITYGGAAILDGDGFTGGGQVGCNWQIPQPQSGIPVVFGVEGDFNWIDGDASDTRNVAVGQATGLSVDDIGMDWFATIRGRIGWAFDRILIYGTGGVAFTKLDISKSWSWSFIDGCPIVGGLNQCHVGGDNSFRTGFTIGGGVEWAFLEHWSTKAEYLYSDFGDVTYRTCNIGFTPPCSQTADHKVRSTLQVIRVGVNYKF